MKVVILQEDLLRKLLFASRFVSSRPQLPILANILITAEKNRIKISATNLEFGISLQVGAKVEKEGSITIPARIAVELISNLPAGQITLEERKGALFLSTQSFSATISGISSAEFPPVSDNVGKENFSIPNEVLTDLASKVVFSAAVDDSRPVLTGIFLTFGEKITAVATDGFRLSLKEIINVNTKGENRVQLLVPAKAIDEVYKVFQGTKEISVRVEDKEKKILFGGENGVLSSKLLEGEFPDYIKIIPIKWSSRATVSKEEFVRAVKASSVFAREAASVIKIGFEKDRLRISAESKQYGNEEIFIEAKTEGEEVEVAYNYRFILEFLESVVGEEVTIETEGPTLPAVFIDTKDQTYKHLIMPVRIQT